MRRPTPAISTTPTSNRRPAISPWAYVTTAAASGACATRAGTTSTISCCRHRPASSPRQRAPRGSASTSTTNSSASPGAPVSATSPGSPSCSGRTTSAAPTRQAIRVPPDSITPSISSSTSTRPAWRANTAPLPDWTEARWAWNTATRPRSHAGARSSRRAATCTTRRYSPSRRNALARCCCRAGCAMTTTPRRPAPPGHARRRQASAMPKKTATASPPVRSAGSSA